MIYDMIIIGGGAAGVAAAKESASLGKRVCIFEQVHLGGSAVWYGMVPYQAMIKKMMGDDSPSLTWSELKKYASDVQKEVYEWFSVEELKKLKIDIIIAPAYFVDDKHVKAAGIVYQADRIIIASGLQCVFDYRLSKLKSNRVITAKEFLLYERLPSKVIVLGSDKRAIQLVELLVMLGVDVIVISEGSFLEGESFELKIAIRKDLEARGIIIYDSCSIQRMEGRLNAVCFVIEHQQRLLSLQVDLVVVYEGLTYAFDFLKLNKAGVEVGKKIITKPTLQTTNHAIYAVGDCTSFDESVASALYQGKIAARNAWVLKKEKVIAQPLDQVSYLLESGSFGITEDQAIEMELDYHLFELDSDEERDLNTEKCYKLKVLADKHFKVIGAHSYGHQSMNTLKVLHMLYMTQTPLNKLDHFMLGMDVEDFRMYELIVMAKKAG